MGEVQVRGRITPPLSPKRTLNNNTVPGNFAKGSLIQLANGELRRVEDMRTEDFVVSAQQSPELRLADSTVVRIKENSVAGTATITLSYNKRRTQVSCFCLAMLMILMAISKMRDGTELYLES